MADTPSENTPPAEAPSVEDLQAQVEKWRNLSRTNEKRWNDTSAELETLRQSQLSDAERAIEAARDEGRRAALAEAGTRLADAELRAQASAAGVTLPSAEFLNMAAFSGPDGAVNSDAIKAFVTGLPAAKSAEPEFAQGLGLGRQGGSGAGQLTRDDLSRMTPREINAARAAGLLDALMLGQI
ncbi:hypothetical protein ACFV1L_06120 [Kitasatospora sp. NPDC059646]|uniref:hypothetical protein n=1 Tax=Kitasatospora sp. NPDC059646 TaxID=3346893 RepID=UPI00368E4B02